MEFQIHFISSQIQSVEANWKKKKKIVEKYSP